jgi:hypothetical protein
LENFIFGHVIFHDLPGHRHLHSKRHVPFAIQSDMFHLPAVVVNEPWFRTTLVDFYDNIAIISFWVVYKENNWLKGFLWIMAFIILRSIATGFYVFLQLMKLTQGQTIEDVLCRRMPRSAA